MTASGEAGPSAGPCDRCGTFTAAGELRPRGDGALLCPACWPLHSRLPLQLSPLAWARLLVRPARVLRLVKASPANLLDVVLVALLALAVQFATDLTVLVLENVLRAHGLVPFPFVQFWGDAWAWVYRHPWWGAAVVLSLWPSLDVLALRVAGNRDAGFRKAARLGALAAAPLCLTLPLQLAIVACWLTTYRAGSTAFLWVGLALTVPGLLLPVWCVVLRLRLMRALFELGWWKAAAVAIAAPAATAVVGFLWW